MSNSNSEKSSEVPKAENVEGPVVVAATPSITGFDLDRINAAHTQINEAFKEFVCLIPLIPGFTLVGQEKHTAAAGQTLSKTLVTLAEIYSKNKDPEVKESLWDLMRKIDAVQNTEYTADKE